MTDGLDIRDIHHRYDTDEVVRGVSLAVGPGEIVCLLGPSGCGKTTCLRLAAGLERLRSGEIRVAGTLVAGPGVHVPPEERRVGLVLQDYALFPHLTATANVAFGLSGPGVSRRGRADRERVAVDLLAQVGLAGYETAYPHMLSGGQQQRVALARALAPEPDVMLMDEPFSGLDVTLRGEVRETTAAVLKQRGAPTLVVTHDPDEALAIGDRIAIMRDGRIVQSGTAEDIYLNPADPFVMTFFGHSNRLAGRVEGGGVATPFGRVPAPGLEDGRPGDLGAPAGAGPAGGAAAGRRRRAGHGTGPPPAADGGRSGAAESRLRRVSCICRPPGCAGCAIIAKWNGNCGHPRYLTGCAPFDVRVSLQGETKWVSVSGRSPSSPY